MGVSTMISPEITAIVIATLVALAFSGGFALSDWHTAGRVQRLNANNALLAAANDQCAQSVAAVRLRMETTLSQQSK
jgi:hypothetical protein